MRFFRWARSTLDMLCDRPDHLQRLGVIGSGTSLYPLLVATLALLGALAFTSPEMAIIALPLIFYFGVGIMILFGVVVVVMIGLVKGIETIRGSFGGASIEIEADNDD